MAIHYALFRNKLSSRPDAHAGVVQLTGSAGLEDIVRRMLERGSTVTRTDILAVLEDAIAATEALLLDGRRVNFGGLVELFPRVRGIFDGAADGYDPKRHRVDVAARVGSRVRKGVRENARVIKDDAIQPAPLLLELRDIASDTINKLLTPENIGQLTGSRLKYDPGEADEGVYCVAVSTQAATKVTTIQKNMPSQVVFLVPALAAGWYWLEVRNRQKGTQQLRMGRLPAQLQVGVAPGEF
ncbi:MAG: DNA-binding domain-containing protein [Planctomycetota bacterium]